MLTNRKTITLAAFMTLAGSTFAPCAFAQSPLIDGTVTKIDEAAGKITLRHGPIKRLDMDEGMTMVYRAQDPAMLKQVKVGDKIKFDADTINGQLTLTKVQKGR
jgi:Cu(I)/Ag(I) efflux system periplasmic protein CusF